MSQRPNAPLSGEASAARIAEGQALEITQEPEADERSACRFGSSYDARVTQSPLCLGDTNPSTGPTSTNPTPAFLLHC
jgi:hypothetical protein